MPGKSASGTPASSHPTASGSVSAAVPPHLVSLERRSDGSVLVRVRSEGSGTAKLPDAVFAFRVGDPQYAYWLSRLQSANGPKD